MDELGTVAPLEDGKGVADLFALLHRVGNVLVLGIHVCHSTHALQHTTGMVVLAPGQQRVGRVGHDDPAKEQQRGGDDGQQQGQAPLPFRGVGEERGAVGDDLGEQDADGGRELKEDVEGAARRAGGHLRQVERNALGGKADAHAQHQMTGDHHAQGHGARGESDANQEAHRGDEDGRLAPKFVGKPRGKERGDGTRQVEGGGEELQGWGVKRAVDRGAGGGLLLGVDIREECLEEVGRGRNAARDANVVAVEGGDERTARVLGLHVPKHGASGCSQYGNRHDIHRDAAGVAGGSLRDMAVRGDTGRHCRVEASRAQVDRCRLVARWARCLVLSKYAVCNVMAARQEMDRQCNVGTIWAGNLITQVSSAQGPGSRK